MGRTNIVLDDRLVREGRKYTGIKTNRALVDYALGEVARRSRQQRIFQLQGMKWEGNLEEMRKSGFENAG